MPDHVHFFCAPGRDAASLSELVRRFKGASSHAAAQMRLADHLWQAEFFDHLLRSGESYACKWAYVRDNPVRAGLCEAADQWPYQGEIHCLFVR